MGLSLGTPTSRFQRITRVLVAPLILLVASIGFVSANSDHAQMSPWDEYVYIDYLSKIPTQGIVREGEQTGELARQYYSCNGVGVFGKVAPQNCATDFFGNDLDYPFAGKTTASAYTPLYFAITWVMAQPFIWATGGDIVTGGRLAGSLWLGAAGITLFFTLGRFGVSKLGRYAASMLLIATPAAWTANTYISTDAPSLFAGGAMLLLAIRYAQTGKGAAMIVLTSLFVVALKVQNFIAVVLAILFLLLNYLATRKQLETRNRSILAGKSTGAILGLASTALITPFAFQVLWMIIARMIAVSPGPIAGEVMTFGLDELIHESLKFYGSLTLGSIVPAQAAFAWALARVTTWLLIAGTIGIIVVERRSSAAYSLAVSTIVVSLTAGPALAFALWFMSGNYFELPPRYGLSLLPSVLTLAAIMFDKRVESRTVFIGLAGLTYLLSLTPFYPGDVFG